MPPQKQEIRRIQINQSQPSLPPMIPPPQPLPQPQLLPQLLPPIPLPPQQNKSRIIQMQLPNPPLPLLHPQELLLQPQFVAVKSLMFIASKFYLWFIVCTYACQSFWGKNIFPIFIFKLLQDSDINYNVLRSGNNAIIGLQYMDKGLALISRYSKIGV